jgi:hypothetical protein
MNEVLVSLIVGTEQIQLKVWKYEKRIWK